MRFTLETSRGAAGRACRPVVDEALVVYPFVSRRYRVFDDDQSEVRVMLPSDARVVTVEGRQQLVIIDPTTSTAAAAVRALERIAKEISDKHGGGLPFCILRNTTGAGVAIGGSKCVRIAAGSKSAAAGASLALVLRSLCVVEDTDPSDPVLPTPILHCELQSL